MRTLRSHVWLWSRPPNDNGFSTTNGTCDDSAASRTNSARCGATIFWADKVMSDIFYRLLDGVGEQHSLDSLFQLNGFLALDAAVQFGFHLSRMWRQQQDAVADLDGFGNGVGDEQH